MWAQIRSCMCSRFFEILLLLTLTAATSTITFEETKCIQVSSSECDCTYEWNRYRIVCPDINVFKYTYNEKNNDNERNECDLEGAKLYNLLPKMNIGNCESVDVSYCQLFDEPIAHLFDQLDINNVKHLKIFRNSLGVNFTRLLTELSGLEELAISSNKLTRLPADLFADLSNVNTLRISESLVELPQNIFDPLGKLTQLDLSLNDLQQLPNGIFRNQHNLEELNLSSNRLRNLNKATFKGATSLQKLDLSQNELSALPSQLFATNKNLTILNIYDNRSLLKFLPSAFFANLPHLQEVRIHCRVDSRQVNVDFSEMDWSRMGLQNEGNLICKSCAIEEIPGDLFTNSSKWADISLAYNELRSLPVNLFANQHNLNILDLSHNKLKTLQNGMFRDTSNLTTLNLTNNQLTELPGSIFTSLVNLEKLDLGNNRLSSLPNELFRKTTSLVQLKLSHNELTEITVEIFAPLVKLKVLYLDNNHIIHMIIDAAATSYYSTLTELVLAGNPWDCDCAIMPLMLFVERRSIITDFENIFCATSQNFTVHDYLFDNGLCQDDHRVLNTLIVCISIVSLLISVTITAYYKYETEIQVWIFRYTWLRVLVSEYEVDKQKRYDAFISYSHKDKEFIGRILVPELEQNGPIRFKLCVHVRDFIVGGRIPDQIVSAIGESRRTIVVLSKHFIESNWALLEFRLAHQAALNEKRNRVIVIMYGDIGDIDSLDPLLKVYLKTKTYLEWGDPRFWDRLRIAMPQSVNALSVETLEATTAL